MHELELYKEMYYPEAKDMSYRSEGIAAYLMRKYGVIPNNTWINIYAYDLKIQIGPYEMSLGVGTEIPFYTQDKLCVGVGIIENRAGMMKFTPIYTENQYGKGFKPGDMLFGYIFGFPFDITPKIVYSGGYQQYEVKALNYVV